MIAGYFHKGSGLGNMLHRYVALRCLAMEKHYDWGMIGVPDFKGYSFLNLDFGDPVYMEDANMFHEKRINDENGVDIRDYDPELWNVQDNTVIDGEFQDERYWEKYAIFVNRWFKTEPLDLSDNLCVINFRGGEYKIFPDLYLTQKYWNDAVALMRKRNPKMYFKVVTDDPEEARKFFPDFEISHDIGSDWRHIRWAKNLILSNSSFAILPAWLGSAYIIAPHHWGRHNIGVQAMRQNIYKGWDYLRTDGTIEEA